MKLSWKTYFRELSEYNRIRREQTNMFIKRHRGKVTLLYLLLIVFVMFDFALFSKIGDIFDWFKNKFQKVTKVFKRKETEFTLNESDEDSEE